MSSDIRASASRRQAASARIFPSATHALLVPEAEWNRKQLRSAIKGLMTIEKLRGFRSDEGVAGIAL
jgi:hypothetical protein